MVPALSELVLKGRSRYSDGYIAKATKDKFAVFGSRYGTLAVSNFIVNFASSL